MAGGSVLGTTIFWDIRMPSKVHSVLHETQKGDVLSVNFRQSIFTAGSDDDSIAVFDLSRAESEPLELLLNPEHPVRVAGLAADGLIYFETLDNYVGCYDFDCGVKRYMHCFENSHLNKDVYFVKSNALSLTNGTDSQFRIYGVDGGRVREHAVGPEGLSESGSYSTGTTEQIRDCDKIGQMLALVCTSGKVIFSPQQEWDIHNIIDGYYTK